MFETNEVAELNVPDFARDSGMRYWGYIERSLHTEWIHMEYRPLPQRDGLRRIAFLTAPEQLIEFAKSGEGEIVAIGLVVPPHVSDRPDWTMFSISEVWEGTTADEPHRLRYIFVDADNVDHDCAPIPVTRAALNNLTKVITIPSRKRSS